MADMQELIARLETAEAGSRELDCEIYAIENPHMRPVRSQIGRFFDPRRASERSAEKYHISGGATGTAARYTTSIDAALALGDRIIPGWWIELRRYSDGWYVKAHSSKEADALQGFQKPAALALCIAILKAKAQGEGG